MNTASSSRRCSRTKREYQYEYLERKEEEKAAREAKGYDHFNKKQKGNEPGKVGKYVAHAMATLRYTPPDLDNIVSIRACADRYLLDCIENDIIPNITGLCRRIGITTRTLNEWKAGRSRNPDYKNFAQQYAQLIEEVIVDLSLDNKCNNIAAIVQLKNHFGYTDEQKMVVENKQSVIDDSLNMQDVLDLASAEQPKIAQFSEAIDKSGNKE